MTTDARRAELVREARAFVAKIGYPRGAFSEGGLDESALVDLLVEAESRGIAKGRAEAFEAAAKECAQTAHVIGALRGSSIFEALKEASVRIRALAQADAKKGDGG